MSLPASQAIGTARRKSKLDLAVLTLATLACLVPFLNKAYCVDDPLFLWAGKHIQKQPLDFFNFAVNWDGKLVPMHAQTKNPPLTCYYIAAAATVVGWSEPALHAAFLLPALGTIWGTWYTARQLCREPLGATLCALATPVFLVSSTNVMCDTMSLCFWVWAVGLWIEGLEPGRSMRLMAAALLIAASALTKYFGVSLIPLLTVYTLIRSPRQLGKLAVLAIPIAILAAYQWWTKEHYGRGLLLDAAEFASSARSRYGSGPWMQGLSFLCFSGGCCLPAGFCAPWMLSRKQLALFGLLAVAIAGIVALLPEAHVPYAFLSMPSFKWWLIAQIAFHATLGGIVFWLALADFRSRRDAGSVLLALWIAGTVLFAGYVNWTCNGRSILPMAPALGILIVRRIEDRSPPSPGKVSRWMWGLAPAAGVALMVAWADYCQAGSAREAAETLARNHRAEMSRMTFQGHWGFQYYMQELGARPVDFANFRVTAGNLMVVPAMGAVTSLPKPDVAEVVDVVEVSGCPWLTTWDVRASAGFYGSFFGPMPFVFCSVPTDIYGLWRFRKSASSAPEAFRPNPPAHNEKWRAKSSQRR